MQQCFFLAGNYTTSKERYESILFRMYDNRRLCLQDKYNSLRLKYEEVESLFPLIRTWIPPGVACKKGKWTKGRVVDLVN